LQHQHGDEGDQRRQALHDHDRALDRPAAVGRRDQHAGEEEQRDLPADARIGVDDAPQQAGGQEAVVQPLIGGQRARRFGEFSGRAERSQGGRFGPNEHF
jgi:hypothetical protein